MRQRLRSHLTYANVMVTILAFVVLGGSALAATGGNFILGKPNVATSTTSLSAPIAGKGLQVTNTSTGEGATALGLNTANGHPPFTVSTGTKVAKLNADRLDGIDSTGFLPSGNVQTLSFTALNCVSAGDPGCYTPFSFGGMSLDTYCEVNSGSARLTIFNVGSGSVGVEYVSGFSSATERLASNGQGLVDIESGGPNVHATGSLVALDTKPETANFTVQTSLSAGQATCRLWLLAAKPS